MTTENAVTRYAAQQGLDSRKVGQKLMSTVMPNGKGEPEDLVIFMGLAERHGLDPLLGECYAFSTQSGAIRMVIGIDGWSTIMNRHPQFDGVEVERVDLEGKLHAMRATLYRKDRAHPIVIEEYLEECKRNTGPWKSHPSRMLRHKVLGQVCRVGLGITGVMDEDERERHEEALVAREAPARISMDALRPKAEEPEPAAEGEPEEGDELTPEQMDAADATLYKDSGEDPG